MLYDGIWAGGKTVFCVCFFITKVNQIRFMFFSRQHRHRRSPSLEAATLMSKGHRASLLGAALRLLRRPLDSLQTWANKGKNTGGRAGPCKINVFNSIYKNTVLFCFQLNSICANLASNTSSARTRSARPGPHG